MFDLPSSVSTDQCGQGSCSKNIGQYYQKRYHDAMNFTLTTLLFASLFPRFISSSAWTAIHSPVQEKY